jgi:2-amino-4-hydroxy-6-hydroxymethyldihydropteridine diphosphokinase
VTRPVVLSLGSNLGEREASIAAAVAGLRRLPRLDVTAVSSLYVTAPVGVVGHPDYVNAVVLGRTTLAPRELLRHTQALESALGRVRRAGVVAPRTLDIDLICVGDLTIDTPDVTLPHPRATQRAFVLVPWLELDPDAVLPGVGRVADVVSLLDTCGVRRHDDSAGVR